MSIQQRYLCWIVCDGCRSTYGDEGPLDDGYEDELQLRDDAKADGWRSESPEATEFSGKWFCELCAVKRGLVALTPIQQAALMHGKKVVLA